MLIINRVSHRHRRELACGGGTSCDTRTTDNASGKRMNAKARQVQAQVLELKRALVFYVLIVKPCEV